MLHSGWRDFLDADLDYSTSNSIILVNVNEETGKCATVLLSRTGRKEKIMDLTPKKTPKKSARSNCCSRFVFPSEHSIVFKFLLSVPTAELH
jgi:hypothetical protein